MQNDIKVYYVTRFNLEEFTPGIKNKIECQIDILKQNFGAENCFNISLRKEKNSVINRIISYANPLGSIYDTEKLECIERNSFVYIRYIPMDFKLLMQLIRLAKRNVKILVEIPTFPFDNESNTLKEKLISIKDRIFRIFLRKYITRIITYSNDLKILGIDTINISNAINENDNFTADCNNVFDDTINLIGVAVLAFWHGYDRLIKGLGAYYKNGGKRRIVFHLVGFGQVIEEYKQLVNTLGLEDKVIFHGKLLGKELNKIYSCCDIGIDALGRHRSGIYYNSSLKGKEYLLKGLPIVSGVVTELDSRNDFNYYLRVPADETPVNMNDIVAFYDRIYSNENRCLLKEKIRQYAIDNFSYEKAFQPIVSFIQSFD